MTSRRQSRLIALVFACAGLGILSLMPLGVKHVVGTTGSFHVMGHITAFAALTTMALSLSSSLTRMFSVCLTVLTYAFTLELLESIVYGGVMEFYDVRTDAIGILLGALACLPFLVHRTPRNTAR